MKKKNFKFIIAILSIFMGVSILHSASVRIMPLGDSITEGYIETIDTSDLSGYRNHLWYMLQDAGYDANFVGSQVAGEDVEPVFDVHHEGYPGWTSYALEDNTYAYLIRNPADIVLLHIGTNDHRVSTDGVEQILDEIDRYERDSGQIVKVFVAMIIDRQRADTTIEQFNEYLKVTIGRRIKNGDNLTLVNMYTGAGMTVHDYSDVSHPNDRGYSKMAAVWFNAIMGPDTPGLYAFPYTLVDWEYIDEESIIVNNAAQTVEFVTEVPDNGIIF